MVEAPFLVLFNVENHTKNLGNQIHNQFSNYVSVVGQDNKLFQPQLTEFCGGK